MREEQVLVVLSYTIWERVRNANPYFSQNFCLRKPGGEDSDLCANKPSRWCWDSPVLDKHPSRQMASHQSRAGRRPRLGLFCQLQLINRVTLGREVASCLDLVYLASKSNTCKFLKVKALKVWFVVVQVVYWRPCPQCSYFRDRNNHTHNT